MWVNPRKYSPPVLRKYSPPGLGTVQSLGCDSIPSITHNKDVSTMSNGC